MKEQNINPNVLGTIGQDNLVMKDCPFHLPKQNLDFFTKMQNAASKEPYEGYEKYGNAFNPKTWKTSRW